MLKAKFKLNAATVKLAITIIEKELDERAAIVCETEGKYTTVVGGNHLVMLVIGTLADLGERALEFCMTV